MKPYYPKAIQDTPEGELDPLVVSEVLKRQLLYGVDDRFECLRIVHCEVSENLAVETYVLSVDGTHKLGISHTVLACSGIDTGDPEGAEIALFVLAVAVCISQTFFIGVLGNRPDVFPGEEITAGLFQDFLAASS